MKVVLQRVKKASVEIDKKTIASINKGLLILLGIESEDNQEDISWLVSKIVKLRIFNDDKGVMNLSVKDIKGQLLVVSQFTLHASTKKGNRPSYIKAARPETAVPLYTKFITKLKEETGTAIQTGKFGAMMDIHLVNDGPVTIIIDSKNKV